MSTKIPADLENYWSSAKTFEGFCAESDQGEYVVFYSKHDQKNAFDEEVTRFLPSGFLAIGSNGSGEMIVYATGKGYGLLPFVHSGSEDFQFISHTLEEFWRISSQGNWFN